MILLQMKSTEKDIYISHTTEMEDKPNSRLASTNEPIHRCGNQTDKTERQDKPDSRLA